MWCVKHKSRRLSLETCLIALHRTLFVSSAGLEHAKTLITAYKQGKLKSMTPELWQAKKVVDSTLHPGTMAPPDLPLMRLTQAIETGQTVLLPFRMSCFVLTNLVVTAGMLTPGLGWRGILGWQITNQSVNVAINFANANKSTPLSTSAVIQSYLLAVSASCSVALGLNAFVPRMKRLSPSSRTILTRLVPFAAVASAGALNVFLMRGEEIRRGIDIFPSTSPLHGTDGEKDTDEKTSQSSDSSSSTPSSLGKSRTAAWIAVSETALSRVLNSSPIMILPPLILIRLQRSAFLSSRPRLVLPTNLGLIFVTSVFALPLALGAFPQRQKVKVKTLEKELWDKVPGDDQDEAEVEFNRGI